MNKIVNGKTEKEWIQTLDKALNALSLSRIFKNRMPNVNNLEDFDIYFHDNGAIIDEEIVKILKSIEKTEELSSALKLNLKINNDWEDEDNVVSLNVSALCLLLGLLDREEILKIIKILINYVI